MARVREQIARQKIIIVGCTQTAYTTFACLNGS